MNNYHVMVNVDLEMKFENIAADTKEEAQEIVRKRMQANPTSLDFDSVKLCGEIQFSTEKVK